jgi:hypothetical protein
MKPYPTDWEPVYIETEPTERSIKDGYAQKFSLYGLTKEEFLELAERQGYSCLICNTSAKDAPYRLAVDHDHYTNEIRGLLCSSCNWGIGILGDNPDRIQRAVGYLTSSRTGVFVRKTNEEV